MLGFEVEWVEGSEGVLSVRVSEGASAFTWSSGVVWELDVVLHWLNDSALSILRDFSSLPLGLVVEHGVSDAMCFEFLGVHDLSRAFDGVFGLEPFVVGVDEDDFVSVFVGPGKQVVVSMVELVNFFVGLGDAIVKRRDEVDAQRSASVTLWPSIRGKLLTYTL